MNTQVEYQEGRCSFFRHYFDRIPIDTVSIQDFVTNYSVSKKSWVEKIRLCDDDEQRKKMKLRLPAITPAGTFTIRRSNSIRSYSGFLSIDLDYLGESANSVKVQLSDFPGLAYCGLSVSGKGLFLLVKISDTSQYNAHLEAVFSDLAWKGLSPDPACKDITRLRFLSYDPDPIVNFSVRPYERQVTPHQDRVPFNNLNHGAIAERVERCIEKIGSMHLDITADYRVWISLAYALANEFGEMGRNYFHSISRFYPKYNSKEADRTYTSCLKGSVTTISTFFYHCKKNGIRW